MDRRSGPEVKSKYSGLQSKTFLRALLLTGTVAAAFRYLAKALLLDDEKGMEKFLHTHQDFLTAKGNLASDAQNKGLGWKLISEFLSDVPGINTGTVKNQLANLKQSGAADGQAC